jgi:hypothetical protein
LHSAFRWRRFQDRDWNWKIRFCSSVIFYVYMFNVVGNIFNFRLVLLWQDAFWNT